MTDALSLLLAAPDFSVQALLEVEALAPLNGSEDARQILS
jgi:hypothetical protein